MLFGTMALSRTDKLEQIVIYTLNVDGWRLEWTGDKNLPYDAKGKTPKGKDCVMEMKFRNKYYEDKMLEKDKHDSLMALGNDVIKFYFVNDPKGNFMYWLDTIVLPDSVSMYCPDATRWAKKRLNKDVYLLQENQATIINVNDLN